MQNISRKESDQSSIHSMSPCVVSCPSWWNSTGSQIPQSCLSKSLSLNMDSPRQHFHNVKQLGFPLQDQDSSSTQSTGQSHNEVATMGEGNPNGQCISAQSGYDETHGRRVEGDMKSVLSLGTPDFVFPRSQVDYSQSVARIPYPYADPYFLAAYGPQAIIHHQMVGVAPARVPLPLDLAEDEPIFVNAKQYRGIIRRRQARAKLEAQNKLLKARKPYLHESRHLHALKRARGSGGRFLNTKKPQHSKSAPTTDGQNASDSEVIQSETSNAGASTTSCYDITSVSNSDSMFRQPNHRFSGYPPHLGGTIQSGGGMMCNGSQHRVPVI